MTTITTITTTVRSADGTEIAYERTGSGAAVILVDGALCHREFGTIRDLAALLAEQFTVYAYDRRGRGESGDAATYAVEREVEDIAALIEVAGGSASVYGISSGAVLALAAADSGLPIERLALYEAPMVLDDSRAPAGDYVENLHAALAADDRSKALKLFMALVGMPRPMLAVMPLLPPWKKLKAVAPTLAYDAAVMGDLQDGVALQPGRWAGATMPVCVIGGGRSDAWMQNAQRELAAVLPNAEHETLEGQNHMVKAKALAPLVAGFFAAGDVALAA